MGISDKQYLMYARTANPTPQHASRYYSVFLQRHISSEKSRAHVQLTEPMKLRARWFIWSSEYHKPEQDDQKTEAQSAPTCIRIPPYSSRTAPIHRYTPKQNNTPTYSRRLLRMNVITFETCWAIKNFHKVTSSWLNLFSFTVHIYKYCEYLALCKITSKLTQCAELRKFRYKHGPLPVKVFGN